MSESRTGGPLDLNEVRARLPGGSRYRRSLIDAEAAVVRLIHEVEALRTALRPPAQGEVNRLALAIIGLLGEKELLGRAPTEQETWKMLDGLLKVGVRLVGAPERDL